MGDLNEIQSSQSVKIAGGQESNHANVSDLKEVQTCDTLNNGGLDTVLTVGTTPVELKVGGSRKTSRKYVVFMPLDTGFKFGFSNTTQSIPVFKSQLVLIPVGENTEVWFVNTSTNKQIAIGEL
jgi:hypothetical protein